MAASVLEGAKDKGAQAILFPASEFSADLAAGYDAIAFGCPSMGAEELEERFAPMFSAVEAALKDKKSRFLAPTAGEMENGCATGSSPAAWPALFWPAKASSATKRRTKLQPRPVELSAQPLRHKNTY